MNDIVIRQGSDAEFDRVYEDMKLQFPSEELKPKCAFKKMFSTGATKLMLAERGGSIVGYFIFHCIGDIAMLDHIAVLKQFHSGGIGTAIIDAIRCHYPELKGMFLEVEPVNPSDPQTVRRAAFYKKCGLYKVDVNYLMPAPDKKTVPMDVWFLNSSSFSGTISPGEVKGAIRKMFPHIYGVFEESMRKSLDSLDSARS